MNLLSWNCRGIGQAPAVRALSSLVRAHRPCILFLSETVLLTFWITLVGILMSLFRLIPCLFEDSLDSMDARSKRIGIIRGTSFEDYTTYLLFHGLLMETLMKSYINTSRREDLKEIGGLWRPSRTPSQTATLSILTILGPISLGVMEGALD